MPTLHIANKNYSSWSLRPWVLMKVLGIPFEEVLHPFSPGSNYEAFRAFSPTGKVPCLVDGDIVVWESLAIVEYLAEDHPAVWPADKAARAFARAVSAEMHGGFSALRNICTMNCGLRVALSEITRALRSDIDRIDAIWSEGLSRFGGPFLAGDTFTAADAFFAPVAFRVQTYGLELSAPAAAYGERLRALPAMIEWYEARFRTAKVVSTFVENALVSNLNLSGRNYPWHLLTLRRSQASPRRWPSIPAVPSLPRPMP